MDWQRLEQQVAFIMEIDQLKTVYRRTYLTDTSRFENSAEHSWHIAVMAMLLVEYANTPELDQLRVIKMLLIHDLVEVDAGDTFAYDSAAHADKAAREQTAADRLFGLLPADQAAEFRALWDEFESRQSPEAKFAGALDRLQPMLHNLYTHGRSWREHGVRKSQVVSLNRHTAEGAADLWAYAEKWLEKAVGEGDLAE